MSETTVQKFKQDTTTPVKTPKTFTVRNIKKDYCKPTNYENITTQFHIELGDNYNDKIVEDRKVDWQELANKDIGQVGLANVLALASKRGDPLSQFMFKDSEAMDLGDLDPNDPNAVNAAIAKGSSAQSKLEAIAKQLGLTVDALAAAFIKGTLEEVIKNNLPKDYKQEEVKENA